MHVRAADPDAVPIELVMELFYTDELVVRREPEAELPYVFEPR